MKNYKFVLIISLILVFDSLAQSQTLDYNFEVKNNFNSYLSKISPKSVSQTTINCSDTNYLYCEDFESVNSPALPTNITTSSLENGYNVNVNSTNQDVNGFYTGNSNDANVNGYWPVPSHTQFAMTNDDACKPNGVTPNENNNCDLSFETFNLPMIDLSNQSDVYLIFDFYHDKNYGGGDAKVEVKIADQNTWSDISGNLPNIEEWQEGIFSLANYSGMDSIYIRILWSDNNNWSTGLAIDNIVVAKLEDNELSLVGYDHYIAGSSFISNYSIIPTTQISDPGVLFRSIIRNKGNNDQDSVRLKVEINSEDYQSQSFGKKIESLERDTFIANLFFNTNDTGTYLVNFFAQSDSTTSDTLTREIQVSEYTYARDNNEPSLSFSLFSANGSQPTIEHGNAFDILAPVNLYAVDVFISENSYPNGKIQAKLYQITSGNANFLMESNLLSIANTNSWQSIKFPNSFSLEKDNQYLVTVGGDGTITDTTRIGVTSSKSGSYGWRIYNGYPGSGGTAPSDGIYLSIPMVRMNFDPNVPGPIGVNESENIEFSIYPNPNNGEFTLSFDKNMTNSMLEIHNVLGQLVYSEELEKRQSIRINLMHLEKGIYSITINGKTKSLKTQKVVIR